LTFGDRLRAEREKRSIGLEEISSSTKIRKTYLEALERNEFGELPGEVFNKGFVRAYAEFLGTDPEPLLRAYTRELRVRTTSEPTAAGDPLDELRRAIDRACAARQPRVRRRLLAGGLLVGVTALAGLGAVLWLLRSRGDPPAVAARPVQPVAVSLPAPPPPTPEPSATAPRVDESIPSEEPVTPPALVAAPAPPPPEATISIGDFGVGQAVDNRALVGRTDRLPAGRDAWFWTLVVGGRPGDRIHHVWLHEDRIVRVLELPVDGPRWRTYSRQPLPPGAVGNWAVEARDLSGAVLARSEFLCVAPS